MPNHRPATKQLPRQQPRPPSVNPVRAMQLLHATSEVGRPLDIIKSQDESWPPSSPSLRGSIDHSNSELSMQSGCGNGSNNNLHAGGGRVQQQWIWRRRRRASGKRQERTLLLHTSDLCCTPLFSPVSSLACSQSNGPVDDIAARLTPALPTAVERGGRVRRLIKFCVMCDV